MASSISQELTSRKRQRNGFWGDYDLATVAAYSALLTGLEAERESYRLSEVLESGTTPAHWLTIKIIEGLVKQELIKAEPHLYAPNCKLTLNHKNDDCHLKSAFEELKKGQVDHMDKSLLSITRAYLKANLQNHISAQLKSVGIDLTPEEGDFETFAAALERRSLAELYMIVWQATQNLSASNLRFYSLSDSASALADQIEDTFLEILNRYESKGRVIKPFRFIKNNRSPLSLVLFNSAFGINSRYHMRSLKQILNKNA